MPRPTDLGSSLRLTRLFILDTDPCEPILGPRGLVRIDLEQKRGDIRMVDL